MTRSGAWSRYRRAKPPESPCLGRWQQVLADALDQNLAIGSSGRLSPPSERHSFQGTFKSFEVVRLS
jgi:hypothetical protein